MKIRPSGRLLAILAAAVVLVATGIAAAVILTDDGTGGAPSVRDRVDLACSIAQARGDLPTGEGAEDARVDPETLNELALEMFLIKSAGAHDSTYAEAGKSAETAYERGVATLEVDGLAATVADAEEACTGTAPQLPQEYADRLDRYVDFGCRLGLAIREDMDGAPRLTEATGDDLVFVGQVGFMLNDADRDDMAEPFQRLGESYPRFFSPAEVKPLIDDLEKSCADR